MNKSLSRIKNPTFRFAITSAEWSLPNAPVLLRCPLREQFMRAGEMGYDAIEMHLRTPEGLSPYDVVALQKETGIPVSAVATGLAKLIDRLCFVDPDPAVRRAAVQRIRDFIDWSAIVGCGIIVGSMRGNLPLDDTRSEVYSWEQECMEEIVSYAEEKGVVILLEAINRYENNYLNTAEETIKFVKSFHSGAIKVHLDTFHMNIEEADMCEAIRMTGKELLGYVHFADNNRRSCGDGCLDFGAIMAAMNDIGYAGYASVECIPFPDCLTAARRSLSYLKSLIE